MFIKNAFWVVLLASKTLNHFIFTLIIHMLQEFIFFTNLHVYLLIALWAFFLCTQKLIDSFELLINSVKNIFIFSVLLLSYIDYCIRRDLSAFFYRNLLQFLLCFHLLIIILIQIYSNFI